MHINTHTYVRVGVFYKKDEDRLTSRFVTDVNESGEDFTGLAASDGHRRRRSDWR
uniref:Uncharacterized protein n=1 Tax=Rhizophora mucronata TaxID=61149 RepID=A0A2P2PBD3_RHIMU